MQKGPRRPPEGATESAREGAFRIPGIVGPDPHQLRLWHDLHYAWQTPLPEGAATVFEGELIGKYPEIGERLRMFLAARPELRTTIHDPVEQGQAGRRLAAVMNEAKLRRVLARMLDENEFLSPYGIRALSRYHAEHPYVFRVENQEYGVSYLPAESERHVRRQLELARADLDARQRPDYPGAPPVLRVLR
jgi:hypothetical protein